MSASNGRIRPHFRDPILTYATQDLFLGVSWSIHKNHFLQDHQCILDDKNKLSHFNSDINTFLGTESQPSKQITSTPADDV